MGSSSLLGTARRLAAVAVALGAAALLPATSRAFDVGDDFNDNSVNKSIWGSDTAVHNGILRETNRRLEFTVTTPTREDYRGRRLAWTGPYASDWAARVDVVNALEPTRFQHMGGVGLSVRNCGDPADEVILDAHVTRVGVPGNYITIRGIGAQELTDGSYSGGRGDWFSSAGTLRVSFSAAAKTVTAEFDAGSGFRRLATFGVIPGAGFEGSGNWGMTDADSFCIEVYGHTTSPVYSRGPVVTSGKIYADNFAAQGLIPSRILLLQPNGGEVIPSGLDSYDITWYRPPDVDAVRLQYSLDRGRTWKAIDPALLPGDSYSWHVPTPLANKTACLVKAIAFDKDGRQIGTDRSDRPFTIEVVRITAPDAGAPPLVSGSTSTITWTTNETAAPVTSIRLSYTLDGGATWRAMDTSGDPADDGSFDWKVPGVRLAKTRCKVKITLRDGTNRTVGADVSDGFFTVAPAP